VDSIERLNGGNRERCNSNHLLPVIVLFTATHGPACMVSDEFTPIKPRMHIIVRSAAPLLVLRLPLLANFVVNSRLKKSTTTPMTLGPSARSTISHLVHYKPPR
jgi:hypothetical protein